jgi:hypothetical protein
MASIALSVIGCIDYLAYGTIFTRAMFCPKKKLMFFFPPEKPEMSPGEGVQWASRKKRISYDFNFYVASTKH